MKITPVAPGGQNYGNVQLNEGHTSPDRLASAKSVAMGESPMRMTESDTPVDPQVARINKHRSIKMRVNQTPGVIPEQVQSETIAAPQETQSAKTEASETAASEVTKPLSSQAAAFAKARRALQVKERELVQREQALKSAPQGTDIGARLKAEPLRVLQEQGALTPEFYNSLTEFIVSGQSGINPELQGLKDKIASLEKGIQENFTSRDAQAEESALIEMLYEAEELAKEGEDYQMIRDEDAYDQVLRRIYDHYKKTGRVLDVKSVMDDVENQLITRAERYFKVPKLQSRYQPPQTQQQPQLRQPQMRTLTNRDSAPPPPMDRRTRALMAAMGQLKRG